MKIPCFIQRTHIYILYWIKNNNKKCQNNWTWNNHISWPKENSIILYVFDWSCSAILKSRTKPIIKWKITPTINIGWITNCTKGLLPIKWDKKNYRSKLKEVILIKNAVQKQHQKKSWKSHCNYWRFNSTDFAIRFYNLF
jgi:hypothetical protein